MFLSLFQNISISQVLHISLTFPLPFNKAQIMRAKNYPHATFEDVLFSTMSKFKLDGMDCLSLDVGYWRHTLKTLFKGLYKIKQVEVLLEIIKSNSQKAKEKFIKNLPTSKKYIFLIF